ncbi:MAG: asparagine synthase (glutamine-hydrolyzing) [Elusimicrobia bacterium]|nr:asparagine synthase (glutamine-hydrolyzing) [Elusimicrobiota bacterium]
MCGICGFSGPPRDDILRRMSGAIVHRGPDEDGFYADDSVSLGMRRLSIIDPATGRQPIHNEDSSVWVVMNGEIYNAPELRTELKRQGHRFYTDHSDTETIVHLYEEHGDSFPDGLNGMFAIALWDGPKRRLVLVRDRMGVKPLFYRWGGGRLIFGSEIKALLAHPDCPKEPDRAALYHYFTFKHVPSPRTAFAGISALRPGEMLTLEDGRLSPRTWWSPSFRENRDLGEAEIQERLLGTLADATRVRMRSDAPFGAYLSGGMDSSAVVALMCRASSVPIRTFSLGYEECFKNKESDLISARAVARAMGTEHHEYVMSAAELKEDAGAILGAFDQPFSGTVSTFFLTKLISRHVKVALSGDGADELFGSYLSHRAAGPMSRFGALRERIRSGSLSREEEISLRPCDTAFLERLFQQSKGNEAQWRFQLYLFTDEEKKKLLSPALLSGIGEERSLDLVREAFRNVRAQDPLNRVLEMEYKTQFPDQVLAFVDFLSMAHSVEVRSPFLDYRLVELAASIPGDLKIKDGVVKDVLKSAVRQLLPEGVVDRPKEGFVLPIFDWLGGALKGWPEEVLTQERMARHGFLDASAATALTTAFRGGENRLAGKVWNLMMFQLWWEGCFG